MTGKAEVRVQILLGSGTPTNNTGKPPSDPRADVSKWKVPEVEEPPETSQSSKAEVYKGEPRVAKGLDESQRGLHSNSRFWTGPCPCAPGLNIDGN